MKTLLNELSKKSIASRQINCIDTTISFHSTHADLIPLFTGPLNYFLPQTQARTEDKRRVVTCILAPTTMVEGWPESLETGEIKKTNICDISFGDAMLLSSRPGACLVLNNVGSIYHSGTGQFLCLVKPLEKGSKEGKYPNVLSLATALVSETLILSDKLLVHAGAVGKANMGEIWTGESGSGKTTRILTLVRKGYDFFGEDQVIIGRDEENNWRVWPFWRHIMASAETSKLFTAPQDISDRSPSPRNKYSFEKISEVLQVEKPSSAILSRINKIIPGDKKILATLDFHDAFKEVAQEFLHALLPDSTRKVMDIVLDVISEVPVYAVSWDMLDEFEKRQS